MLKLYLYPQDPQIHDLDPPYYNTVPFSKEGLKHFEIVQSDPDLYYMGQLHDCKHQIDITQFAHFNNNKDKHWIDIEGDWFGRTIDKCLYGANLTINGAEIGIEQNFNKVFVRPTFSKLLLSCSKRTDKTDPPNYKSFGFSGHIDPHGLRGRLKALMTFPGHFELTNTWKAQEPLQDGKKPQYESLINKHLLCLCPKGVGHDTARFYEVCFFQRVPIIIGNNYILGEPHTKFDFFFRINHKLPPHIIKQELEKIYNLPLPILQEKALKAREYFDNVVRPYFQDPTGTLLDFLQ